MTLIVEDGTGLANAESYISVADASTYHAARGNAVWATYDTPTQEIALRNATDYMLGAYRQRWTGNRASQTQALDWPRQLARKPDRTGALGGGFGYGGQQYNFYLPTDIPTEVKTACADLALRAAAAPLVNDVDRTESSIKIGPLAIDYEPGSSINTVFPAVARKLGPLFEDSGRTRVGRS